MYLYLKFKVIVKLFPSENVKTVMETGTAHCWPLCLCVGMFGYMVGFEQR